MQDNHTCTVSKTRTWVSACQPHIIALGDRAWVQLESAQQTITTGVTRSPLRLRVYRPCGPKMNHVDDLLLKLTASPKTSQPLVNCLYLAAMFAENMSDYLALYPLVGFLVILACRHVWLRARRAKNFEASVQFISMSNFGLHCRVLFS